MDEENGQPTSNAATRPKSTPPNSASTNPRRQPKERVDPQYPSSSLVVVSPTGGEDSQMFPHQEQEEEYGPEPRILRSGDGVNKTNNMDDPSKKSLAWPKQPKPESEQERQHAAHTSLQGPVFAGGGAGSKRSRRVASNELDTEGKVMDMLGLDYESFSCDLTDLSRRPPYTFPCLIAAAISESPPRALSSPEIANWIAQHIPYYAPQSKVGLEWKKGIRHALSQNRFFCHADSPATPSLSPPLPVVRVDSLRKSEIKQKSSRPQLYLWRLHPNAEESICLFFSKYRQSFRFFDSPDVVLKRSQALLRRIFDTTQTLLNHRSVVRMSQSSKSSSSTSSSDPDPRRSLSAPTASELDTLTPYHHDRHVRSADFAKPFMLARALHEHQGQANHDSILQFCGTTQQVHVGPSSYEEFGTLPQKRKMQEEQWPHHVRGPHAEPRQFIPKGLQDHVAWNGNVGVFSLRETHNPPLPLPSTGALSTSRPMSFQFEDPILAQSFPRDGSFDHQQAENNNHHTRHQSTAPNSSSYHSLPSLPSLPTDPAPRSPNFDMFLFDEIGHTHCEENNGVRGHTHCEAISSAPSHSMDITTGLDETLNPPASPSTGLNSNGDLDAWLTLSPKTMRFAEALRRTNALFSEGSELSSLSRLRTDLFQGEFDGLDG